MPHTSRNATRSTPPERVEPAAKEFLERGPLAVLATLAAVRVAVPLAALAVSGSKLPGLPRYDYVPTTGDGSGYYAATREFLASWGRLPLPELLVLILATAAGTAALVWAWRRRKPAREWLIVLAATGFALVVAAAVTKMSPPGADVFGWSLVWSLPMLPYRALGLPLDPDIAFGFGLVLSLLANLVTLFATALAGLYATGRRSLGLLAASLFAFWPLLAGLVGGTRAWENGTWTVDAGLAMYTEPLSTALVTVALALLLSSQPAPTTLALAGVVLGLATTVKLTNAIVAIVGLALVAARLGRGRVLPYLAGGLALAPILAAYWPKGYAVRFDEPGWRARHGLSSDYMISNWSDSLLFGPRTLLVLVPLAAAGALALRSWWPRLVLTAWVLGNAVFYSFFPFTPLHPRFLFASLPALFVLWSLGAATLVALAWRGRAPPGRLTTA